MFHNASRKWHVAKHYRDLREYGINGKAIVDCGMLVLWGSFSFWGVVLAIWASSKFEIANSSPFVCPLASQLAEHHPVCGSLPIVAVGASSDWEPKLAESCGRSRSQTTS